MLLIFCPDPRRPTPTSCLGPRHIQISSGKCTQKKRRERNRKEMWKKEVKQTHTEQDQVEDRLKISRVLSLSRSLSLSLLQQGNHRYGQARTIEHKQHPKPNRNRNRNRNSTKTRASLCHLALLCTLFKYLRSFTIFMTAKNITTPTLARRRRRCW